MVSMTIPASSVLQGLLRSKPVIVSFVGRSGLWSQITSLFHSSFRPDRLELRDFDEKPFFCPASITHTLQMMLSLLFRYQSYWPCFHDDPHGVGIDVVPVPHRTLACRNQQISGFDFQRSLERKSFCRQNEHYIIVLSHERYMVMEYAVHRKVCSWNSSPLMSGSA